MRYREPNSRMFNSPELIRWVFKLKKLSTNQINVSKNRLESKIQNENSRKHSFMNSNATTCNQFGIQVESLSQHTVISWSYRDIFIWNIAFRVNTDTADKMDEKSSFPIWDFWAFFSIWLFLVCLYISLLRNENCVTCKRPGY